MRVLSFFNHQSVAAAIGPRDKLACAESAREVTFVQRGQLAKISAEENGTHKITARRVPWHLNYT